MFPQAITPAVRSHLEAQLSFVTDLSNKMYDAMQQISELNLRYLQTCMEQLADGGRQLVAAKDPGEFMSATATQLQSATERWRNYEQQVIEFAANTQHHLSKAAETHVPETSRSVAALADEFVRSTNAEAERISHAGRSVAEKLIQPRKGSDGDGHAAPSSTH